jgi:hypothetical protein
MAKRRSTIDVTGHCEHGHHDLCRGALQRPKTRLIGAGPAREDVPLEDQVWYCLCPCHEGKDVALAEEPVVAKKPKAARQEKNAEREKLGEQLVLRGTVSVPLPDDEKAKQKAKDNMHYAAWSRDLKVRVRVVDGQVVATVKETK